MRNMFTTSRKRFNIQAAHQVHRRSVQFEECRLKQLATSVNKRSGQSRHKGLPTLEKINLVL